MNQINDIEISSIGKLLLHCCCAPCSAAILEWLAAKDIKPTLFYYNPNIYPYKEYEVRKAEITEYAYSLGIDIVDGDYEHDVWQSFVEGYENEKERGARCQLCFNLRLEKTACYAAENGFDTIATTLASSRWKSLEQIEKAGIKAVASYPNVRFWAKNWRKDGLQERRRILLAENEFYNQLYCGCEYSFRK